MCRKSIRPVIDAFINRKFKRVSNTETDGNNLRLFGNLIAYHKDGTIYISSAGYRTVTTKDRLNGLPGVNIQQKKGVWYLNGQPWGGNWKAIKPTFQMYLAENEKSN